MLKKRGLNLWPFGYGVDGWCGIFFMPCFERVSSLNNLSSHHHFLSNQTSKTCNQTACWICTNHNKKQCAPLEHIPNIQAVQMSYLFLISDKQPEQIDELLLRTSPCISTWPQLNMMFVYVVTLQLIWVNGDCGLWFTAGWPSEKLGWVTLTSYCLSSVIMVDGISASLCCCYCVVVKWYYYRLKGKVMRRTWHMTIVRSWTELCVFVWI